MLVVSLFLTWVEPRPVAPGSLQSVSSSNPASGTGVLFNTLPQVKPGRWNAIVIHFSGQSEGTLTTISRRQAGQGRVDAGYHFVVNNGRGRPDGEIELGFRWRRQHAGDYGIGQHAGWFNQNAIGVCLVGDPDLAPPTPAQLRELAWLTGQLQAALGIPAERVFVQLHTGETAPASLLHAGLHQSAATGHASDAGAPQVLGAHAPIIQFPALPPMQMLPTADTE